VDSYELEMKVQVVLLVVEAAAYLGLAAWCLTRGSEGRWTGIVAAGATLVGIILGISAVASFQQVFLDSSAIYEKLFFTRHTFTVLAAIRLGGVLLLVAGFVLSGRRPATNDGSIYGP
jgi:hypothetical protein